jgi:hypothetical protein
MRFLIPPGKRVLELGCGRGDRLAALEPSYSVGVNFGAKTIAKANELHPDLHFVLGDVQDPATLAPIEGPFDYIVIADTIGMFEDIDGTLRPVHHLCAPSTRIIISYYSHLWEPILKLAELLHLRSKQPKINYIATADFLNLMDLAGFEVISQEQRQLIPRRWLGLGPFVNRFIAPLPGIRLLCLRTYIVGRPVRKFPDRKFSASIVIPCRNEKGNIENFANAEIRGCPGDPVRRRKFQRRHISGVRTRPRCLPGYLGYQGPEAGRQGQRRCGSKEVRRSEGRRADDFGCGSDHAAGKADFVNGTRLIYPMENEAMRPLNLIANRCFAYRFSYLVNTHLTDTLCGTKVLLRKDYEVLARERAYFGNFDPFGDFDLIFGAAKQNLRIIETPIHYKARTFGETQISRFRDGWLLLKMVWFAYRKLKAV